MRGCKWCVYADGKCPKDKTCDFYKVPFDKESIVAQAKKELLSINVAKRSDNVELLMDSLFGLQVMVKVLREEFGVPQKELEESILGESMGVVERMRLVSRVMAAKKRRAKE